MSNDDEYDGEAVAMLLMVVPDGEAAIVSAEENTDDNDILTGGPPVSLSNPGADCGDETN